MSRYLEARIDPLVVLEHAREARHEGEVREVLEACTMALRRGSTDPVFQGQVVPFLGFVSEAVVRQVLDLYPLHAHRLFQNPNTSEETLRYLARESCQRAMEDLVRGGDNPTSRYRDVLHLACAGRVLEYAGEEVQAMRDRVLEGGRMEPGRADWSRQMQHRSYLASAVAACPEVPTEVLHEMFDSLHCWLQQWQSDGFFLASFVQSPQADLKLWRKVLREDPHLHLLELLAERREARLDPEIRARLRDEEAGNDPIRVALTLDETDECRSRLRGMMRVMPITALHVLQHPQCRVTERLERADWALLLSSPHAPLRLQAIQLQGSSRELATVEPVPAGRVR